MLLTNQLPLTVFARAQQLEVTVVDCGVAENMAAARPPADAQDRARHAQCARRRRR